MDPSHILQMVNRSQVVVQITLYGFGMQEPVNRKLYLPDIHFQFTQWPIHLIVKHLQAVEEIQTIRLWDLNTGKNKATLTGHSSAIETLAISPDGLTLVSGSYDGTIQFWDLVTGKHKSTIRHAQYSVHAKLSPDGKTLATDRSEEITLWDVKTGEQKSLLKGLKNRPIFLSFSKDGTSIIGMNTDENLIWDTETGQTDRIKHIFIS